MVRYDTIRCHFHYNNGKYAINCVYNRYWKLMHWEHNTFVCMPIHPKALSVSSRRVPSSWNSSSLLASGRVASVDKIRDHNVTQSVNTTIPYYDTRDLFTSSRSPSPLSVLRYSLFSCFHQSGLLCSRYSASFLAFVTLYHNRESQEEKLLACRHINNSRRSHEQERLDLFDVHFLPSRPRT